MRVNQVMKLALVVLFVVSGLVGCASTPPPSQDTSAVSQSDMSQQGEVKGAADSSMSGEKVPSHEAMAGMEKIYFAFDEFTLSPEARKTLADNAEYLKANEDVQVVIEGHCDERGSDEYNLALGESRALAAKEYLVSLGINPKRLSVISYGEEKPAVEGSTESAWAKNRRAEFKAVR